MTERERRERRLLHVRTLQADLAAGQLRRLRAEQEVDRTQLAAMQQRAALPANQGHHDWLLACAERELAEVYSDQLVHRIAERAQQIAAEAAAEQICRQQREQVQHLCDSTAASARLSEQRADQRRLDDLFSAGRLRQLRRSHTNES